MRRAAHKGLNAVAEEIEGLRFNRAYCGGLRIRQCALRRACRTKARTGDASFGFALKEALTFFVHAINPIMPHLAEEGWSLLGYNTLIANESWPEVERSLLIDDTVTIAVQVNGKRRDEIVVPRNAGRADVEAAALRLESVTRAVDGRPIKKVIVVPERIVNVRGVNSRNKTGVSAERRRLRLRGLLSSAPGGCGLHPLYAPTASGAEPQRGHEDRGCGSKSRAVLASACGTN